MSLLIGSVPFAERIHPNYYQRPDYINHIKRKTEISSSLIQICFGADNVINPTPSRYHERNNGQEMDQVNVDNIKEERYTAKCQDSTRYTTAMNFFG